MGATGPIPERAADRRRRNKVDITRVEMFGEVEPPPADERWHKIALNWYESLAESGQAKFYEPSDWATAYMVAESVSRDMKPQVLGVNEKIDEKTGAKTIEPVMAVMPLKGTSLTAYLKAMAVLLVTEGDRRRVQMEITRRPAPTEAPADVIVLDDFRDL